MTSREIKTISEATQVARAHKEESSGAQNPYQRGRGTKEKGIKDDFDPRDRREHGER